MKRKPEEKFTHKVDPRSIHIDQRKQDTRRDAWDRDYLGFYYFLEAGFLFYYCYFPFNTFI